MNSTPKFPTPLAGGETSLSKPRQQAKPRQPLRKARDGHCGELILILANPMARGALARVSGLLLILAAAPAHAAGVCIICPPGHTCPTGEAPIISGTPGQILQRTTTGTQWIDASILQGPQGPQGEEGPAGSTGPIGPAGPNLSAAQLRAILCPTPPAGATGFASINSQCSNSRTILGTQTGSNRRYCWCSMQHLTYTSCFSTWTQVSMPLEPTHDSCARECHGVCVSFQDSWMGRISWN